MSRITISSRNILSNTIKSVERDNNMDNTELESSPTVVKDDNTHKSCDIDNPEESEAQTHADSTDAVTSSYQPRISPPITLLQEICSRNGFTAEYQLLSTEGTVHEPTFKIAVTVADVTVTASGQSKKKARHAAARDAIEKLRQRKDLKLDGIDFESMAPVEEPSTKSVYAITSESNPVGKLQEFCMKNRLNPPDYDTCSEHGLAHERVFVLSCNISKLNLTTVGYGRSKKLAKRQAAENMLALIEKSGYYEDAGKQSHVTTSGTLSSKVGISSLELDADDNSHFIRARGYANEMCAKLDIEPNELWDDINMILIDDVNPDLFYELFNRWMANTYNYEFSWATDFHCTLHLKDDDNNILASTAGCGKNNSAAMRDAVLNIFRIILAFDKPLAGKESYLRHRTVTGQQQQQQAHQEA